MIDLNADIGEGMSSDAALLEVVTSASIACGGHAGNERTMRETLRAARARGVRVGAHPGFADPEHFGRRRLELPVGAVKKQVREQVGRLSEIAREERVGLAYVKLHGALANMTAEDEALARVIFADVAVHFPGLAVMALEQSGQHRAAEAAGLPVIVEAYADRGYLSDGLLAPRDVEGSVLTDPDAVVARCVRLAERGEIVAVDGTILRSSAHSICVHGDTPGALELAKAVRAALENIGTV
ncbi:5-oxoprolinase subunit PxpA [Pelagibacterium xiamenense]|uniref:5-oxoprolinase subunit PxpA n=1 Tax=Pelagibacterium xiamenense TaxID=2901140 RepID=UPI001E548A00|nr:5-oxoprolinase subunit PxpA [Pelagibacterium xiamenense]MCD7061014.1 LamB/YcsF family protein [Pelagibacterium xiamenense]